MRLIDADAETKKIKKKLIRVNNLVKCLSESKYEQLPCYWKETDKKLERYYKEIEHYQEEIYNLQSYITVELPVSLGEERRNYC